jgi:SPP1 gp7 family putative phage head morphogenesis protein
MIRYSMARMAAAGGRKLPLKLPKIEDRLSDYYALLRVGRWYLRQVIEASLEVAADKMGRAPFSIELQFDEEGEWERLDETVAKLTKVVDGMVRRVLDLAGATHTEKFIASAKRAIGVNLSAVVRDEDIEQPLDMAAGRAAGYFAKLGQDVVAKMKAIVTRAVLKGETPRDVKSKIAETLKVSDSHAKLIARDQIATVNSELNQIRHQQAGVMQYQWSTSLDERVRPLHARLEGRVYAYGEPTGAEEGLAPGEPINCRCVAIGIVSGLRVAQPTFEETTARIEQNKARRKVLAKRRKKAA